MKKILLAIICVTVVLSIFIGASRIFDNNFTTEKWVKSENAQKYKYIDDFERKYNILGTTSHEVKKLLGKPYCEKKSDDIGFNAYMNSADSEVDMFYYYRIKYDGIKGWEIYLIKFSANIVVDTSIGIEDW